MIERIIEILSSDKAFLWGIRFFGVAFFLGGFCNSSLWVFAAGCCIASFVLGKINEEENN